MEMLLACCRACPAQYLGLRFSHLSASPLGDEREGRASHAPQTFALVSGRSWKGWAGPRECDFISCARILAAMRCPASKSRGALGRMDAVEHRASKRRRLSRPPAFGVESRRQAAQSNAQARSGVFAFDHCPTKGKPRPLSLSGGDTVAGQLRRTVDVDRRRRGSETGCLRTLQFREHGK